MRVAQSLLGLSHWEHPTESFLDLPPEVKTNWLVRESGETHVKCICLFLEMYNKQFYTWSAKKNVGCIHKSESYKHTDDS